MYMDINRVRLTEMIVCPHGGALSIIMSVQNGVFKHPGPSQLL